MFVPMHIKISVCVVRLFRLIQEQSEQIEKLKDVVERCSNSMPDRQKLLEELHELRGQLKIKNEDFSRLEIVSVNLILSKFILYNFCNEYFIELNFILLQYTLKIETNTEYIFSRHVLLLINVFLL